MLEWRDDRNLVVDGIEFALAPTQMPRAKAATEAGALLLRKPRWMVERYLALQTEFQSANVFELGIYDGGSTALLSLLLRPRRLVSIDLTARPVTALDDFIAAQGLSEAVHPYYGVDQSDRTRLDEIVTREFGSEPLDLVIDDASHLFDETVASFNALFPRLRPGGLFVLEDWSWQIGRDEAVQEKIRTDPKARAELERRIGAGEAATWQNPLSLLVLQMVLTAGYAEGVVSEVMSVRKGWLLVRRGAAALDPDTFDITRAFGYLDVTLARQPLPEISAP